MKSKGILMICWIVCFPLFCDGQPSLEKILQDLQAYDQSLEQADGVAVAYEREVYIPALSIAETKRYLPLLLSGERRLVMDVPPERREMYWEQRREHYFGDCITELNQLYRTELVIDRSILQITTWDNEEKVVRDIRSSGGGMSTRLSDRIEMILGRNRYRTPGGPRMKWFQSELFNWRDFISSMPQDEEKLVRATDDTATVEIEKKGNPRSPFETEPVTVRLDVVLQNGVYRPARFQAAMDDSTLYCSYSGYVERDGVWLPSSVIVRNYEGETAPETGFTERPYQIRLTLMDE